MDRAEAPVQLGEGGLACSLLKDLPAYPQPPLLPPLGELQVPLRPLPGKRHNPCQGREAQDSQQATKQLNMVDIETLRAVFHMPRQRAAEALGLGLSSLKRCCNTLGVLRWPHRKLHSLSALMQYHQANPLPEPDQEELMKLIRSEYDAILHDPNHEVHVALQAKRVVKYKKDYSRKISAINREKRLRQQQASVEQVSDSEDEKVEVSKAGQPATDAAELKQEAVADEQQPCKRRGRCSAADCRDKPVLQQGAAAKTPAAARSSSAVSGSIATLLGQQQPNASAPVPLQALRLSALPNIASLAGLHLSLPSLSAFLGPQGTNEPTTQTPVPVGACTANNSSLLPSACGSSTGCGAALLSDQAALQAGALQALANLSGILDLSFKPAAFGTAMQSAWKPLKDWLQATEEPKAVIMAAGSPTNGSSSSAAAQASAAASLAAPISTVTPALPHQDVAAPANLLPAAPNQEIAAQDMQESSNNTSSASPAPPIPVMAVRPGLLAWPQPVLPAANVQTNLRCQPSIAQVSMEALQISQKPMEVLQQVMQVPHWPQNGQVGSSVTLSAPLPQHQAYLDKAWEELQQEQQQFWPISMNGNEQGIGQSRRGHACRELKGAAGLTSTPLASTVKSKPCSSSDQGTATTEARGGMEPACSAGSRFRPSVLALPSSPSCSPCAARNQPLYQWQPCSPSFCSSPVGPTGSSPSQLFSSTPTHHTYGYSQWPRSCMGVSARMPNVASGWLMLKPGPQELELSPTWSPSGTGGTPSHNQNRPLGNFTTAVCTQLQSGVYRLGPAVQLPAESTGERQLFTNVPCKYPASSRVSGPSSDDALARLLDDAVAYEAEQRGLDTGCASQAACDATWDIDLLDSLVGGESPGPLGNTHTQHYIGMEFWALQ